MRPILWEVTEISFRAELLILDSWRYDLKPVEHDAENDAVEWDELDASTWEDREAAVMSAIPHFGGSLIPDHELGYDVGFASSNLRERARAMLALFRVMLGWKATREQMSQEGWREAHKLFDMVRDESQPILERDLEHVEFHVVYWYIDLFTDVFNRPPTLPHHRF